MSPLPTIKPQPHANLSDLAEGVLLVDRSVTIFPGYWGFNPCVCMVGDRVLLAVRHCTYNKASGAVAAPRLPIRTRNVVFELDPRTLAIAAPPADVGDPPVGKFSGSGYGIEDLRLFTGGEGELRAIGCTTQARKENAPEMVEMTLGPDYRIASWRILRGDWSHLPQKNWVPFGGASSRYLYSIERGLVIEDGRPVTRPPEVIAPELGTAAGAWAPTAPQRPTRHPGAAETVYHARRGGPNTIRRRPPGPDWTHQGIRGGSPLVPLGDGRYLGIGHDADPKRAPHYAHAFYVVDASGKLLGQSARFLFMERPIEFAAGLAIQRDRAIVSFGIDDAYAWLCTLPLAEVLRLVEADATQGEIEHEDLT